MGNNGLSGRSEPTPLLVEVSSAHSLVVPSPDLTWWSQLQPQKTGGAERAATSAMEQRNRRGSATVWAHSWEIGAERNVAWGSLLCGGDRRRVRSGLTQFCLLDRCPKLPCPRSDEGRALRFQIPDSLGDLARVGPRRNCQLGVHELDALNLVMNSNELVCPDSPPPDPVDFLEVARCQWWALRCIWSLKFNKVR
jgi:hypothetical protein